MGRKKLDLTGQNFGRLTVLRDSGERGNGMVIWECECECGNLTKVRSGNLQSGHIKSCGCLRMEISRTSIKNTPTHSGEKNLIGKKFGRLTVISIDESFTKKDRHWFCECECGNKCSAWGINLKNGHSRSCGCLQSETSRDSIKNAHKWAKENDLKENTKLSSLTMKVGKRNTSGVKGVSFDSKRNRWRAQLKIKGETVLNKRFETFAEAVNARKDAEEKYFKPILEKYSNKEID